MKEKLHTNFCDGRQMADYDEEHKNNISYIATESTVYACECM